MKINGEKVVTPSIEVVVIPRQDKEYVFKAKAVLKYEDFEKINPVPKPPEVMRPGGVRSQDVNDSKYQQKLTDWATQKTHWMVLKSLEATEGLEWETVDMSDPKTYANYQDELLDAGFSPSEIAYIINCVTDACGLNQQKIDEATKRFLAGQGQAQSEPSSPSSEPKNTPSGEPANASA